MNYFQLLNTIHCIRFTDLELCLWTNHFGLFAWINQTVLSLTYLDSINAQDNIQDSETLCIAIYTDYIHGNETLCFAIYTGYIQGSETLCMAKYTGYSEILTK